MSKTTKNNIMIVEDDQFLLHMINVKLEKEGYNTYTAENGEEAMKILSKVTPDLMILDLVMPKMNGFEVLEELKKNKKLSKIPVIVFTNLAQESDMNRVKEFGVLDYLIKADTPIQSVVDRVAEACRGRECK